MSNQHQEIQLLTEENGKLRRALCLLIPWAGEQPDGPEWASAEAKSRNRQMFDDALAAALECFPAESVILPDGIAISLRRDFDKLASDN